MRIYPAQNCSHTHHRRAIRPDVEICISQESTGPCAVRIQSDHEGNSNEMKVFSFIEKCSMFSGIVQHRRSLWWIYDKETRLLSVSRRVTMVVLWWLKKMESSLRWDQDPCITNEKIYGSSYNYKYIWFVTNCIQYTWEPCLYRLAFSHTVPIVQEGATTKRIVSGWVLPERRYTDTSAFVEWSQNRKDNWWKQERFSKIKWIFDRFV